VGGVLSGCGKEKDTLTAEGEKNGTPHARERLLHRRGKKGAVEEKLNVANLYFFFIKKGKGGSVRHRKGGGGNVTSISFNRGRSYVHA